MLMRIDFGTWRPNILIVLSLVAWGIGFGWLGVHNPENWEVATGLYIVGCKFKGGKWKETRLTRDSDCLPDNLDVLDRCVRSPLATGLCLY